MIGGCRNYIPIAFPLSENRKQGQQRKEKMEKGVLGLRKEENERYILPRK